MHDFTPFLCRLLWFILISVSTETGLPDFSRAPVLPEEQATRPLHALICAVTKPRAQFSCCCLAFFLHRRCGKCAGWGNRRIGEGVQGLPGLPRSCGFGWPAWWHWWCAGLEKVGESQKGGGALGLATLAGIVVTISSVFLAFPEGSPHSCWCTEYRCLLRPAGVNISRWPKELPQEGLGQGAFSLIQGWWPANFIHSLLPLRKPWTYPHFLLLELQIFSSLQLTKELHSLRMQSQAPFPPASGSAACFSSCTSSSKDLSKGLSTATPKLGYLTIVINI